MTRSLTCRPNGRGLLRGAVEWLPFVVFAALLPAWCGCARLAEREKRQMEASALRRQLRGGENPLVQRRAAILLAMKGFFADEVVDCAVKEEGTSAPLVAPLLGQRALPRLFDIIKQGESWQRRRAMDGLASIGRLEPELVASLCKYSRKCPGDRELAMICVLLSAADPSMQERARLLSELSEVSASDLARWHYVYPVAMSFAPTREWGIALVRKRLPEVEKVILKGGEANDDFSLLYACAIAARANQLCPQDISNLRKLASARHARNMHGLDAAFPLVEWLMNRQDTSLLDDSLRYAGKEPPDFRGSGILVFTLGDYFLRRDELPILTERAENHGLDDRIRVGAIRLLGLFGMGDDRAAEALKRCTTSGSDTIRKEAERALSWCQGPLGTGH